MKTEVIKNGWMKLTLDIGTEILEKKYNPDYFTFIEARIDFIVTYKEKLIRGEENGKDSSSISGDV